MIAISSSRPIFLSRAHRRNLAIRRAALLALFIIPPFAFAAGFFFGG